MGQEAKLYSLKLSHPAHAARLMLERKGIAHRVVNLVPGFHPAQLRLRGFRGGTVPAMRIDGRRMQGSREISRFLDDRQPEPRLLTSPAVEEAERWGEEVLQGIPRRAFRWGTVGDMDLRKWIARDAALPAPTVLSRLNGPIARHMARISEASDANVRADLAALPGLLDRVDELIAEGTIGGEEPNAADFQIATTVRVFLGVTDLRRFAEGRPCAELAMRILPEYPGPIPPYLPRDWL